MGFIKGVLMEEYCRLLDKRNDYEEKLNGNINNDRREKIEKTLASVVEDMTFIKNAFVGNDLDISNEIMLEKARMALDSVDFTSVTICATEKCPRRSECYRYSIYELLIKNGIEGHTCTLFNYDNCTHFIKK